jgi:lipopolysaccharide biosynthesis glycosyltransferase
MVTGGTGAVRQERVIIACSANERYAPGLAVTLLSLIEHRRSAAPMSIYVLDGGLRDDSRRALRRICGRNADLIFLRPDLSRVSHLNLSNGAHPAVYCRLLLPEMLPGCDRAIYLDSDTVILADIDELWATDVSNHPCAGVRELFSPKISDKFGISRYHELGLPPDLPYFNSGVVVMNLECWRAERIGERVIRFTEENRDTVRYWDQDGMNAVLAGRWLELDPTWNVDAEGLMLKGWVPEDPEATAALIERAKIIHYVITKPWEGVCHHPKTHIFLSYLARTPWRSRRETRQLFEGTPRSTGSIKVN